MKKYILFLILSLWSIVGIADIVEINGINYNLTSKIKTAEVTSTLNSTQISCVFQILSEWLENAKVNYKNTVTFYRNGERKIY